MVYGGKGEGLRDKLMKGEVFGEEAGEWGER